MAPQTQKALVVETESAPWQFRTDWPVPKPGPGEVLVKLVAAAINPVDWYVQRHGDDAPSATTYPCWGGCDGAGVVEGLGPDVAGLKVGDKMYVVDLRHGSLGADGYLALCYSLMPGGVDARNTTFQEYCVAHAENTAKVARRA